MLCQVSREEPPLELTSKDGPFGPTLHLEARHKAV